MFQQKLRHATSSGGGRLLVLLRRSSTSRDVPRRCSALLRRQDMAYYYRAHQPLFHSRCRSTTVPNGGQDGGGRGLYSIPELRHPPDFVQQAKQAMNTCDDICQRLSSPINDMTPQEILLELDSLSRILCNVLDAAELCRKTHARSEWRAAAERAFEILGHYMASLNGNVHLYNALQYVATHHMHGLNDEERRFVTLLQHEFERDGIHLPDAERQRVSELANHVSNLETQFQHNLVTSNAPFSVHAQAVLDVLPPHVLQAYQLELPPAGNGKHPNTMALYNNQHAILQTLMRYSESPALRRDVYLYAMTAVPENLAVLHNLRLVRHELAVMLGFASFAERAVAPNMAPSCAQIQSWLRQILSDNKTQYATDMHRLQYAKRRVEGDDSGPVQPWDLSFYTGLLQTHGSGLDLNELAPYLHVEQALMALQHLVKSLFGIDMQEVTLARDEGWDANDDTKDDGQNDARIRRFDFVNDQGSSLGTLYLDLFPRPSKFGHAAHFTVRCGCRTSLDYDDYQTPIVALVCNLQTATTSQLAHSEVVTLFHEFGHALHSLLSRTQFQHLAGTRAAMDFVETPSNLLENYCWDANFLKILAVDAHGQTLSNDKVRQLRRSRTELASIEQRNQMVYALFDQELFGIPDRLREDSTAMFARLHHEHDLLYADGTHWHSRFGHLVSYGAAYYGYLYAQQFSTDLWQTVLEDGRKGLDRAAGEQLWKKMLIHGGAVDPRRMLQELLGGRDPMDRFSM